MLRSSEKVGLWSTKVANVGFDLVLWSPALSWAANTDFTHAPHFVGRNSLCVVHDNGYTANLEQDWSSSRFPVPHAGHESFNKLDRVPICDVNYDIYLACGGREDLKSSLIEPSHLALPTSRSPWITLRAPLWRTLSTSSCFRT